MKSIIYTAFELIEKCIIWLLRALLVLSSNVLMTTLFKVVFSVVFEIFVYAVLGLACVFIAAIIAGHDFLLKQQLQKTAISEKLQNDAEIEVK